MPNEVLTPDVIEELPLEQVIEKTLVKNNVTDQVIKALKKQYGGMKLKSLTDKQSFLEIKDARNAVRKVGILTEKLCKMGRDDANKIRTMWIEKEKEVLGKIAEVQDPLDAEIKKFEDEVARLEELEFQRQEEQFMKRQTTLLKMEAKYEGNSFSLGSVSYEISNIKEADEEIWTDTILPKFQREFAKVEAEKAEIEKQKLEAEEKLKAEQAELLRQQEELKKAQEEMRVQQEELNKLKAEREQKLLQEEQKRNEEIRVAKELIYKERQKQLLELGLKFDGSSFSISSVAGVVSITVEDITSKESDEWTLFVESKKPFIEEAKTNILKFQEDETKRIQEEAAQKERERIEEEQRQVEIKKQQDEQLKLEEAAKASDKDKWANLIYTLSSITMPEFKSGIYKNKAAQLVTKINEIKNL